MSDEQPTNTTPTDAPASGEQVTAQGSYRVPADYYSSGPTPPPNTSRGCRRWWPLGCGLGGCLFVVLLFVGFGIVMQRGGGEMTGWFVAQMNEDIQRRLTVDVAAEQRSSIDASFKQLETLGRAEKITLMEMQPLMQSYRSAVKDNRVDGVEAKELDDSARQLLASRNKANPAGTPKP